MEILAYHTNGYRVRTPGGRSGVSTDADRALAGRIRRAYAKAGRKVHVETHAGSVLVTQVERKAR